MRRFASVLAGSLLVLAFVAPAGAASPAVRLAVARPSASTIRATVTGAPLAGAWRVVARGSGAAASRFARVTATTGDEAFIGTLEFGVREHGRDRVIATYDLTPFLGAGAAPFGACNAKVGLCVDAGSITTPANGNSILRVAFTTLRPGARFDLSAGVRIARAAAFALGPWINTGTVRI